MEFKPIKSRSLSIVKGKIANERFHVNNEPIPTVLEKPIKSLSRWYSADLKDMKWVEQLRLDTISGLKLINNTTLPGKLRLWWFQFGLLPRLMWPISIYEVTRSQGPATRGSGAACGSSEPLQWLLLACEKTTTCLNY